MKGGQSPGRGYLLCEQRRGDKSFVTFLVFDSKSSHGSCPVKAERLFLWVGLTTVP